MKKAAGRPFFISASIVFLWLSLILELIGLYSHVERLDGWYNVFSFSLAISFTILILVTLIHLQTRSTWGQVFGMITFSTLLLSAFGSIYVLIDLDRRINGTLLFAEVVIALRLVFSAIFLAAFIFTTSVKDYFKRNEESSLPPPPPVFED